MVIRRGIGAAVVAAVVFSVILASNAVIYSAAEDRAGLYGVAEAEDSTRVAYSVLSSAVTADALASVQGSLSRGTMECAAALRAISLDVGGVTESESSGGVSVSATASLWTGGASADNLTSVAPYQGAERGELNLAITVSGRGGAEDGVAYSKVETHLVHLPARPSLEGAVCESAAALLAQSIAGTRVGNCTAGMVTPVLDRLGRGLASASGASGDGFGLALAYSFGGASACMVRFSILVTQGAVQGPGGLFSVAMEEEGSAIFAPPARTPPG